MGSRHFTQSGCDLVRARDGGRRGALVSLPLTGDAGQARAVRTAIVALAFISIATEVHAQTPMPVDIPLQYVPVMEYPDSLSTCTSQQAQLNLKLAIYVGINGGMPLPYVFDTGSPVFNAVYNSNWWMNVPSTSSSFVPSAIIRP